jgi:hypothetical protein
MLYRLFYIIGIFSVVAAGCLKSGSDRNAEKNSEDQGGAPPEITFEQVYYDFGSIKQGEKVSYSFQFENTGGSPLIIKDAYASCGCTVPEYDTTPIQPGKKGHIEVIFDSAGRRGNQYKTMFLKTNSPDSKHRLTIKASVLMN